MLEKLHQIERQLPDLLVQDGWQSLYVDYHPPIVERVWRQEGDYRINLHCIHPCEPEEALMHPHPWPSAIKILSGKYRQGIGYSSGRETPPIAATTIMTYGSSYEMVNKDGWHYVAPIDDVVMSLMVTGKPWDRWAPRSEKQLNPLSEKMVKEILEFFGDRYKLRP